MRPFLRHASRACLASHHPSLSPTPWKESPHALLSSPLPENARPPVARPGAGLLLLTTAPAIAAPNHDGGHGGLSVTTLSSAPDLVTGGDALVEVSWDRTIPHHQVTVLLDGQDVTDAFGYDAERDVLVGLVEGMDTGEHVVEATVPGKVGPMRA